MFFDKQNKNEQRYLIFNNDQLIYPEKRQFFKGELLCYPMDNMNMAGHVLNRIDQSTDLEILKDIVILKKGKKAYLVFLTKKAENFTDMFSLVNTYAFEHQLNNI